jgi:hypothetical protein
VRFLVDIEVIDPGPDTPNAPFPEEQVRAWLEHYVLATDVVFEIAGDPEAAGPGNEYPDGRAWDGRNLRVASVRVAAQG